MLALPKTSNRSFAGHLGGVKSSYKKFGQVREFVKTSFNRKKHLIGKKTKREICLEITRELQQRPHLIRNLSKENLFDWVVKQIRKIQRGDS